MSMADKRKKLLAGRQATQPPVSKKLPHLTRASVMVLAAGDDEALEAATQVELTPLAPAPDPLHPQDPGETAQTTEQAQALEKSVPQPLRHQSRIQGSRVPAERLGEFMDRLMQDLEAKGASRRTVRLRIPYSIRPDKALFTMLREGEGSAASRVLEAFHSVPRDVPDAIAGAAETVAMRRRRPGRQGLGQSGTVTVTLDGVESETLEVLARRAHVSCSAYLEGCVYIWAVGSGRLDPES